MKSSVSTSYISGEINQIKQQLVMRTPFGKEFERIAEAVSLICNAPFVYIAFFEGNQLLVKSKIGNFRENIPSHLQLISKKKQRI